MSPALFTFLVGLHKPNHAQYLDFACISVNRLWGRVSRFIEPAVGWMMDSGAFTELNQHGEYRHPPAYYAAEAARWVSEKLMCIVAQDYMCEPFVLKLTGLTVEDHQRKTIERYDQLVIAWEAERIKAGCPRYWPPIMPVLQGWTIADYLRHIEMYGDRLKSGAWVGVGSVCKRQGNILTIELILSAINGVRPDLLLHGFGVKLTALRSAIVRALLHTADSMAWSFAARKNKRDANSVLEAIAYKARVEAMATEGNPP